jgi:flagellar basal-body rod protein FlgC
MSLSQIFDIAGSGMMAQSLRLNTTSSNIANANSVSSSAGQTYRARHPMFSTLMNEGMDNGFGDEATAAGAGVGVQVDGIVESKAPLELRYEPGHPAADENGYVHYPNVNIVEEMADMISASRSFQTNVDVLDTTKQLMQSLLTLGR